MDVIENGLSTVEQNTERLFEAELYRQKARALHALAAPDAGGEAQSLLKLALKTAKRHGARSLELRAKTDLEEVGKNQSMRGKSASISRRVSKPPLSSRRAVSRRG